MLILDVLQKKMKFILSILIAAITLTSGCVAIEENAEKELLSQVVGTWEGIDSGDKGILTLREDKSATFEVIEVMKYEGTFELSENRKIQVHLPLGDTLVTLSGTLETKKKLVLNREGYDPIPLKKTRK
tara:strand:- start:92 stop:478 length:387 start_codon:yes stop_codon:yes gene_type:complete